MSTIPVIPSPLLQWTAEFGGWKRSDWYELFIDYHEMRLLEPDGTWWSLEVRPKPLEYTSLSIQKAADFVGERQFVAGMPYPDGATMEQAKILLITRFLEMHTKKRSMAAADVDFRERRERALVEAAGGHMHWCTECFVQRPCEEEYTLRPDLRGDHGEVYGEPSQCEVCAYLDPTKRAERFEAMTIAGKTKRPPWLMGQRFDIGQLFTEAPDHEQ